MTVNDVLTIVRGQLRDPNELRWSDAQLYPYINVARAVLLADHPEGQYISKVANTVLTDVSALTDDVAIGPEWLMGLAHLVTSYVLGEDSDDAANAALSKDHYQKYLAEGQP